MNTVTLVKKFCNYTFVERNCEKAVSLLATNIYWVGTSDQEDVHSREEAHQFITKAVTQFPVKYQVDYLEEHFLPQGDAHGNAFLHILLTNKDICLKLRITATSCLEDTEEKIDSIHFSISDTTQQIKDYFSTESIKAKLAQEKEALVMSTMAGGLMGGYCEAGFPFYFVNERMLEYLGYKNEPEFVADIDGLIENTMHPDDREMVNRSTKEQLTANGLYVVDYRMRKRDGNYI